MRSIRLTGLLGSHPLGALAAFGLLRIVSKLQQFGTPKLSWESEHDWVAVLHTESDVATDQLRTELIQALVEQQRGRATAPFITWSDDIKVEPPKFEQILKEQARACSLRQREVVDFLAAFGSEVIHARSTGDVKPTAFHMTAGQQKFLKSAREVADSLNPDRSARRGEDIDALRHEVEEAYTRALFGPWHRQDRLHALGWDPSTEALYALLATAPGDEKPISERAAVWLAFEALPLFPCFPSGSRLRTRGFDSNLGSRTESFSWPIWKPAISVNTLASLLVLPDLTEQNPDMRELRPRGIIAVYRSACDRDTKGRGMLRHAVLCAGQSSRTVPIATQR